MLVVYSRSRSFENHIDNVVDGEVSYRSTLSPAIACQGCVYLVHASSFSRELPAWLETTCSKGVVLGIADDIPQVENMLAYTQAGVLAYFNTYMAAPHYAQMLRLLTNAQSWFPPALLHQAFNLARSAIVKPSDVSHFEQLTKREREVALAVAKGKNNRLIADECDITERTVKSHLTHIFKKLDIKDRVSLVIYLKQSGLA